MADLFKPAAIRAKNPAIQRAIGQKNVKKVDLPLFTTIEAASWAAQRILAELSYPLLRATLTVNRKAFRLCPGDLFILNYAPYGIQNVVMRVLSIEEEGLSNERLKVQAIQDVEYLGDIPDVVGAEGEAEPLDWSVARLNHVRVEEPPYVVGELPNTVVPIAAREKGTEIGAIVLGSVDGGNSYYRIGVTHTFSVYGELTSHFSPSSTSFTVDIAIDADRLSSDPQAMQKKRNLLLIDSEILCFETITPVEGTESEYEISGLHRGLFDTAVQDHPVGSGMYSLDGLDIIQWSALEAGNDYYFKIVPFNSCNIGNVSDAIAVSLHFRNRSLCPLPVINLKANDASSGATYHDDVTLTWDPRVRWSDIIPHLLHFCDGFFRVEVYAGDRNSVTGEAFTSDYDNPVELAHDHVIDGSVVVTGIFQRDTDYTMDYSAGTITVLSSGTMLDNTEYYIDYQYFVIVSVSDESFISDYDSPVQLVHDDIVEESEVVTTTDGSTTFTRGTDYTMDYSAGTITVLSTGTMENGTEYHIDYDYRQKHNVTNEAFTSDYDNPVQLAHDDIVEGSEVVRGVFEEDADYSVDYWAGRITVLSSGTMLDGTEYYIDYEYSESFSLVRTEETSPAESFFNQWTYTKAKNLEDNGQLAGYLRFKVYDFIDEKRISFPTEIEVRKEQQE